MSNRQVKPGDYKKAWAQKRTSHEGIELNNAYGTGYAVGQLHKNMLSNKPMLQPPGKHTRLRKRFHVLQASATEAAQKLGGKTLRAIQQGICKEVQNGLHWAAEQQH